MVHCFNLIKYSCFLPIQLVMRNIFILFFFLIAAGCSTGRLVVESTPKEGQVFIRAAGQAQSQSIGQSPTSRAISEVRGLAGGADTIVVEIRKAGYFPKSVVVTDVDSLSDIKVNLELSSVEKFVNGTDPNMGDAQRAILAQLYQERTFETNKLIDDLFEAQRLAQVGRIDDSEKKLDEIESKHPNVASVYEIRGGLAFMRKDYPKALDAFRKAARSNPNNIEVLNMKQYLERLVGEGPRVPAGGVQ